MRAAFPTYFQRDGVTVAVAYTEARSRLPACSPVYVALAADEPIPEGAVPTAPASPPAFPTNICPPP